MEDFIELLKTVGATNIIFTEKCNENDVLEFELRGKKVVLSGQWHNDSTDGIDVYIEDA